MRWTTTMSNFSSEENYRQCIRKKLIVFVHTVIAKFSFPAMVDIVLQTKKVEKQSDGTLSLTTTSGEITSVETLIWAVGRSPNTEHLGLDKPVS